MPDPADLVAHLDGLLLKQQRDLRRLDAYYEGKQPLRFLAYELKEEFGERLTELVINFPEWVAGAYEARLDLTGFRFPESTSNGVDVDKRDAAAWGIWQDNDMDRRAPEAHQESIALGRAYAIVGARAALEEGPRPDDEPDDLFDLDTDSPLITVEHPTQCIAETDPRTRQPSSALKRWKDPDGVQRATLYLPGSTRHFVRARHWVEQDVDEHGLGVVPVVPLVNRGRMLKDRGRSEFESIIPIADAVNKMATDMMVSGEFHAMPRRWALGMTQADFEDEKGNPISPYEQIAGRVWAHSNPNAKVGQFPETDLAVFHNTIKLLAQLAGQLAGLPPHYTQFTGDNPASADAIRSSEAQMVKRVERKQVGLGADWRRVMAIALRIRDGDNWDSSARRMKVIWRNAATPTVAQAADAAVKLFQAGITTRRQTRIDLGYAPEEIRRMEQEDADDAAVDPLGTLTRAAGQQG